MKKPIKRTPVRKGCSCVSPNPSTVEQQLEWEKQNRNHAEGRASAYRDAIELFTGRASSGMNGAGLSAPPSRY